MSIIPSTSPITTLPSSHEEIGEPSWLDRILSIFRSTIVERDRLNEVEQLFTLETTSFSSPQGKDEKAQVKQILKLAKDLLNTNLPSFDNVFYIQTLAQITLSNYSQKTPSFIEQMNDLNGPCRTKPYHWFFRLIKQDRIHCAEQVYALLPPMGEALKSSTSLVLALAYIRHGRLEKALELLKNIPNSYDRNKVSKAVAAKYCDEKSYDKVQELVKSNRHNTYLLEDIALLFSKHGQFDRALSIAKDFTQRKGQLLKNIALDIIDHGLKTNADTWIDRAFRTVDDPSLNEFEKDTYIKNASTEKMAKHCIQHNDDKCIDLVLKISEHNRFNSSKKAELKFDIAKKMRFHGMKTDDTRYTKRAHALAISIPTQLFDFSTYFSYEPLTSDSLSLIRDNYHSGNLQKAFEELASLEKIVGKFFSSEEIEEQRIAIDFLTKKLFKDNLNQEIFDFATRENSVGLNPLILKCCKKLLDLLSAEGRFDDVFRFLGQLGETNNTRDLSTAFIKALCHRYRWNLQHTENPHVFLSFAPPIPERVIEALATGRYAKVVTLLKESFPQEEKARQAFLKIVASLPTLEGAYLADHFPHDWKVSEDIMYSTISSTDDETQKLYNLLPK